MVMIRKPYKDFKKNNIKIRIFDKSLKETDLKWHRDKNNRYIKIISGHNWKIQLENSFPVELIKGKTYFVNSKKWHRLIKGNDRLILKIKSNTYIHII